MVSSIVNTKTDLDVSLTDTSTQNQKGLRRNGNGGFLHIPKRFRTGASSLNCFVLYPGHSLGESYLTAEMQIAYSTASDDWVQVGGKDFML